MAVAEREASDRSLRAPRSWLSEKEIAVLRQLALGRQTDEIAEVLFLSPHTVRSHVKNGMKKLGARNRTHAVAIALTTGAIKYEPERAREGAPRDG